MESVQVLLAGCLAMPLVSLAAVAAPLDSTRLDGWSIHPEAARMTPVLANAKNRQQQGQKDGQVKAGANAGSKPGKQQPANCITGDDYGPCPK